MNYSSMNLSHFYSGKPLGFGSVFTAFGVLFFGLGIALILGGLEKLSNILGLQCLIFQSYGATEEPSTILEFHWSKLLHTKDEEIFTLTNQVSLLKQQLLFLRNKNKC